jgi:ferric-dicitrate binding protein FerR (iron transport regulator)
MEHFLSSARPTPRDGFVRSLESSLFDAPAVKRRPAWIRRPLVAAGTVSAALAAAALLLGLVGLSPLKGGSSDPAAARGCVTRTEVRWVERPTLVIDADGQFHVRNRKTKVFTPVKHCP